MTRQTRRTFLRLFGGAATATGLAAGVAAGEDREPFDPNVHGFGFRNWSTRVPTFPEHDHDDVSEQQVARTIDQQWREPLNRGLDLDVWRLSDSLIETVARQLYVSVNQLSASNGHCYGMVFAAQGYYETPEALPSGYGSASDFSTPGDPMAGEGSTASQESTTHDESVGARIDELHIAQFLNPFAWLGRRALLSPDRIDYRAQIDSVTAVIDTFGTAGLTVIDTETRGSHQILAYDYHDRGDQVVFRVYEPNQPAGMYREDNRPELVVEVGGEAPRMRPYRTAYNVTEYDAFLYNRFDRLVQASGAETFDHVEVSPEEPEPAFSRVALFLTDSKDVSLAVVDPEGIPVTRPRSPYLDRQFTTYHAMRYRYAPPPGEYHVALTGRHDGEYGLEVLAADGDGELCRERIERGIDSGVTHTYTATIPASSGQSGSVDSTGTADWALPAATAGAAGAIGVAAGLYAAKRLGVGRAGGDTRNGPGE